MGSVNRKPGRESNFFEGLSLWIGAAAIALPLAILCWQSYEWLQLGAWPQLSTADVWTELGWSLPLSSSTGGQHVIDWVFGLPAAVSAFFLGIGASLLVLSLARWHPLGSGD